MENFINPFPIIKSWKLKFGGLPIADREIENNFSLASDNFNYFNVDNKKRDRFSKEDVVEFQFINPNTFSVLNNNTNNNFNDNLFISCSIKLIRYGDCSLTVEFSVVVRKTRVRLPPFACFQKRLK